MKSNRLSSTHHHLLLVFILAATLLRSQAMNSSRTFQLWPGTPPNEAKELPPEADTTKPGDRKIAGRSVVRLGNVSKPSLTIYRPSADIDTGASVLICPGGFLFVAPFVRTTPRRGRSTILYASPLHPSPFSHWFFVASYLKPSGPAR